MSYAKIMWTALLPLLLVVNLKGNPDISRSAENVPSIESEPLTQIALIAVGEKPPRRYEKAVNGNEPRMLLPTSEEVPPSRLYYKGKGFTDLKSNWKSLSVSFNSSANLIEVAPESELLLYRKKTESGEYEQYVNIEAAPIGSQRICFLLPQGDWSKSPNCKIWDLGEASIKGKQFVFINLSQKKVLQAFDGVVTEIGSMKNVAYRRREPDKFFRLAARDRASNKLIFNTAVKGGTRNRANWFVFYDANPLTEAGRTIGVFRMIIPE